VKSRPRWLAAVTWLAVLTLVGTLGFVFLEGLSWTNALYLTVVTISTVGYGDIAPVTPAGQIFTTALIIGGVGAGIYLISTLAEDILDGRLRDFYLRSSMMRKIGRLNGHVIVCGFGRFGRIVVEELVRGGRDVIVIEMDAAREPDLNKLDLNYIIGSATSDAVLEEAGVKSAAALVVATSSEADGVFITLSARELNSALVIHARGESAGAIRRLERAGANFVTSPYQMGGMRTAASILRPAVVDFLELSSPHRSEEIDLEEVLVCEGSALAGHSVSEIEARGLRLRIVALKQSDRGIELVPESGQKVECGDHLVVIGDRDQLAKLAQDAQADSG
jgi:voltage-gated potassium channel